MSALGVEPGLWPAGRLDADRSAESDRSKRDEPRGSMEHVDSRESTAAALRAAATADPTVARNRFPFGTAAVSLPWATCCRSDQRESERQGRLRFTGDRHAGLSLRCGGGVTRPTADATDRTVPSAMVGAPFAVPAARRASRRTVALGRQTPIQPAPHRRHWPAKNLPTCQKAITLERTGPSALPEVAEK